MTTLLHITNLHIAYGGIEAVKGIDLVVGEGELVTLVGANGAGKTTTLKAITGTLPKSRVSGDVQYGGLSLIGQTSHQIMRRKLVMVPEGRGVFMRMSVMENLLMGAYTCDDRVQIHVDIERWFGIFPRLKERATQLAGTLSGGEQQMLVMARALMCHPSLLLLDEPSMGLSPLMVDQIFNVIRDVAAQGMTILLVEQNARRALEIADRGYVMESGYITMSGNAGELLNDERVRTAYLGEH
jgi:branched-chain amino acid transport system ATP-binding protein